ncbi:MAG: sugar transferase, partial [Micrococcales bacterium]|nr:sugar transferase [Micrococcales bacterium]
MSEAFDEPRLALVDFRARPVQQPLTQRSRGLRVLAYVTGAGDAAVIALATLLAAVGRTRLDIFGDTAGGVQTVAQSVAGYIIIGWLLVNVLAGTYRRSTLGVGTIEYARILQSGAIVAGAIGITSYLTNFQLSRGFFVLLFLIGVPGLLLWRYTSRSLVHAARTRGRLLTRVIIAGDSHHIDDVASVLRREAWLGYRIVGAIVPDADTAEATADGIPVVGSSADTAEVVTDHEADLVVFAEGSFPTTADFRRVAWDLEGHDVQMAVVPSLSDISAGRISMRPVGGLPLVHVDQPQSLGASRGSKRAFDIAGALFVLILASPVMAIVAAAIKLQDRGPVMFRQTRVGRDGQFFECLKFRSMVVDAEAQLAGVTHLSKHQEGVLFKMVDDPRVTRIGHLIRRFSIDELPQLFNVLRGDMSLVGPRPALPAEVRQYDPEVKRRLHVRPGLTGL